MYADDPALNAVAASLDRMISCGAFEQTLLRFRQPRPTRTLRRWLEIEIAAAYPEMKLNKACALLLDDTDRLELGGALKHFRRLLSGEVTPQPSTIFQIGEKLRNSLNLHIASSSGLAVALASGRFFDAFGAAGVLHKVTGYVWPVLGVLPGKPSHDALAIPRSLEGALPEVWQTWLALRRSPRALRPWRSLVESTEDIPIDGLIRFVDSWPNVDFMRC